MSTLNRIFNETFFRRTGIAACSSVFLLFVLGGLVRVTGSGMGCPDWPRCFGLWAPPTCDCELPADYKAVFLKKRIAKLNRFAKTLEAFGLNEKAQVLRNDPKLLVPEEFNAFKAWTEYINRIFGVIAGLLSLGFFLLALSRIKKNLKVTVFGALGLLMLLFNAWLGSIVVATNLLPGIVTIHFLLSFLCVYFTMTAMHNDKKFTLGSDNIHLTKNWSVLLFLIFVEVVLGTLARESIENLSSQNILVYNNMLNFKGMGTLFMIHRFLPAAIFVYCLILYRKRKEQRFQSRWFLILGMLSLFQIILGAFNIVLVLPPVAQVLHIVVGAFLPLVPFYFLLAKLGANPAVN